MHFLAGTAAHQSLVARGAGVSGDRASHGVRRTQVDAIPVGREPFAAGLHALHLMPMNHVAPLFDGARTDRLLSTPEDAIHGRP